MQLLENFADGEDIKGRIKKMEGTEIKELSGGLII